MHVTSLNDCDKCGWHQIEFYFTHLCSRRPNNLLVWWFQNFKIFSFLNCHTVELCRLAHQFSLCFPTVCKPNTCYVFCLNCMKFTSWLCFIQLTVFRCALVVFFFWLFVFIDTSTAPLIPHRLQYLQFSIMLVCTECHVNIGYSVMVCGKLLGFSLLPL